MEECGDKGIVAPHSRTARLEIEYSDRATHIQGHTFILQLVVSGIDFNEVAAFW